MGQLGSRFLFVDMPEQERSSSELAEALTAAESYRDKRNLCRASVADFLNWLFDERGGTRGIARDRANDPVKLVERIADYAKLLAHLRAHVATWKDDSGEEQYRAPTIESPERAMTLLYALARGHAIIHGRNQLHHDDLAIVRRAAVESVPDDRRKAIRAVIGHNGRVSTADVAAEIGCTRPPPEPFSSRSS
jgi:hypothetical protein